MPKVHLHYVIINGCDGSATVNFYANEKAADLAAQLEDMSEPLDEKGPYAETFEFDAKGKLLNPSMTKAELLAELAEMRGDDESEETAEDDETSAPAFNAKAAAADPDAVYTGTIYYVTRNGGDGSVSARFVADAECAQLACDIEDEGGEPFNENPHSQTLKFNGKGELLNPDATVEELEAELRERNGEDEELDEDEETPAAAAFNSAAANDNEETLDVAGKTVVFTGRLSTMTRKEAESAAIVMGAHVTDSVTRNTDILVVGEDAGSKLAKAQSLGVTVMTESEWNRLTQAKPAPKAPGGPKF